MPVDEVMQWSDARRRMYALHLRDFPAIGSFIAGWKGDDDEGETSTDSVTQSELQRQMSAERMKHHGSVS